MVEHFIGADCLACWSAAPPTPGAEPPGKADWSLDWIVPAADDAPMAAGALPEAADRLAALGAGLPARLQVQPAAFDTRTPLAAPRATRRFYVHAGPPTKGYIGVQLHASGAWPAGSGGWIALVETLPPGTRGAQVPRRLVRALVGPLPLPDAPGKAHAVAPLFALRWPDNANPENLSATAWIQGADGRIIQLASDRCRDPS